MYRQKIVDKIDSQRAVGESRSKAFSRLLSAVLSHPKFHRKDANPDARMRLAKKILNALIDSAIPVTDNPSKSYTTGDVTDLGKPPKTLLNIVIQ